MKMDMNDTPKSAGASSPEREGEAPGDSASRDGQAEPKGSPGSNPLQAEAELDEARAEAARLKDQLLRTAADYDNFRKRSRREADDAQKRGKEDMLRDLLPVFDNLERAAIHAAQTSDAKAVADGVRMVLKQFSDTLGRMDIRRIATTGTPFNPAQHEAIQQIETAEHPAGTIVAEVQPGYLLGDRLIRAALVVVAKPGAAGGDGEAKPEPN
jgi:molecular chaperone GrpE